MIVRSLRKIFFTAIASVVLVLPLMFASSVLATPQQEIDCADSGGIPVVNVARDFLRCDPAPSNETVIDTSSIDGSVGPTQTDTNPDTSSLDNSVGPTGGTTNPDTSSLEGSGPTGGSTSGLGGQTSGDGGRTSNSGGSRSLINPIACSAAASANGGCLVELLLKIIDVLLTFALPLIVFYIMYAGFLYVTAQGDTGQIGKAHTALQYAVIGGVLILGAKLIINVIQGTIRAFGS